MRPLHTLIPTKLLAGKISADDQGTPKALMVEEGGPGSPKKYFSLASRRNMWDEVLPIRVGSGRGAT